MHSNDDPTSNGETRFERQTQDVKTLTRKFKNSGVLTGNSEIQDCYQEIQESRIPGRKFKIFQEVKLWVVIILLIDYLRDYLKQIPTLEIY